MSRLAAKSDMPSSCRYSVKNTIAFHGVDPTMPCRYRAHHIKSVLLRWVLTHTEMTHTVADRMFGTHAQVSRMFMSCSCCIFSGCTAYSCVSKGLFVTFLPKICIQGSVRLGVMFLVYVHSSGNGACAPGG